MAQMRGAPRASVERGSEHPEGFIYRPAIISSDEEKRLLAQLPQLPLREFEFHGYLGKRRTASFGWRYDFTGRGLQKAGEIPGFLMPLRERAAALAGVDAPELQHALVTEYPPGAGLGWHKDKAVFARVVGISLLSACRMRFRRKATAGWNRWSMILEPRSAYLLAGAARMEWEHSIPAVEGLRYSITFRSMVDTRQSAPDRAPSERARQR
jgi:alkylated DNA repair dioxygenase AlkB